MKTIGGDAFAAFNKLSVLDVSHNLLHTPAVFLRPLSSLQALNLGFQEYGNCRYCGNDSYPVKYIVNGISELKQLKNLAISGEHTSKDDVLQLQSTSVTDLSIAKVYGIEEGAFSGWHALNSLDLLFHMVSISSNNILKNLSGLQTESLYMLSGLSGRMDFDNFQAPNLKGLTIYNTDVEDIDFGSFSVRTLQCLDISYNRISTSNM